MKCFIIEEVAFVLSVEKPSEGLIREVTSFICKQIIQANMWIKTAGREGKVLLLVINMARDDGGLSQGSGCGGGEKQSDSGAVLEVKME